MSGGRTRTVAILGMKVPMPPWAQAGLAALALVGVGLSLWHQFFKPVEAIQDQMRSVRAEVEAYNAHMMEIPLGEHAFPVDDTDALVVRAYLDGCLFADVQRGGRHRTRMVPDPDTDHSQSASFGPTSLAIPGLVSPVFAQSTCSGQCLPSHPGTFRWWYGAKRDQCLVEVWRQWPDGCTHWQFYNPCNGYWQTDHDGSPLVHWTCCTH